MKFTIRGTSGSSKVGDYSFCFILTHYNLEVMLKESSCYLMANLDFHYYFGLFESSFLALIGA